MVNPNLIRRTDVKGLTPTANAKRLFQAIYYEKQGKAAPAEDVPRLKVLEIVSKMAFYYEKIRNTVDYKDEHLLFKNAIERILKRQIVIEATLAIREADSRAVSEHLLTELIRAGYLPNNQVPEARVGEIAAVIAKYLAMRRAALERLRGVSVKERRAILGWIIALAASDIEERLCRSQVDQTLVDYMFDVLNRNIVLPPESTYGQDREIQIYIGIHRSLFKFDREMIGYILLKYYNAGWDKAGEDEAVKIGHNIIAIKQAIDRQIDHPLDKQLSRIISRYTVFFMILKDVIAEDPVKVYENFSQDPKAFPRLIKQAANKRYREAKSKLWRAAVRSILYIFISKSLLAFILEVPVAGFLGEEVSGATLFINVTFPALLLFLIVLFTRLPGDDNSAKIVEGIEEIVFEEKQKSEQFRLRTPSTRSKGFGLFFGLLYALTFFLSFGAVVWALNKLNFSFISMLVFLFFLALVSFFSIRIRRGAKELVIVEPKENIFSLLSDFFYVPVIAMGKWLSENFSRVNVFVFILDFIIEAPFKVFVTITEEWTKYVRERKEEL